MGVSSREKMRLKPTSHLVLVRQLKQTVKAKSRYSGKSPITLAFACFSVSFNRRSRSKTIGDFSLFYRWFYFTVGFNQRIGRIGSKTLRGFSPIDEKEGTKPDYIRCILK